MHIIIHCGKIFKYVAIRNIIDVLSRKCFIKKNKQVRHNVW